MTAPIFANSATVRAPERLMLHGGRWSSLDLQVRYGLFLSETAGPVLIDTGYTSHAVTDPGRSLGLHTYSLALRPKLHLEGQPETVLARFNLRSRDVQRVIVTHFHADHVSGLSLFPNARFTVSAWGWISLQAKSRVANLRHGIFPELLPPDFPDRVDLVEAAPSAPHPKGHDLLGDGSILSLPLPGHADGHFGLIFPQLPRPLLYAVDAQWLAAALPNDRRPGFPSRLIAEDPKALDVSTDLVQSFSRTGDVVLCHDPNPSPYDLDP
jgi:glyoxylase-like metal-dependent hydrolase (beta-lactamase superfamily II)